MKGNGRQVKWCLNKILKMMNDTKVRILALERMIILAENGLTLGQIQDKLINEYDIKAERKSLYDDIAALTRFLGIEIEKRGKYFYYFIRRNGYDEFED